MKEQTRNTEVQVNEEEVGKLPESRGTTARSVSLSWGAREVGSPREWQGGARHCSRAMVGDSGLENCCSQRDCGRAG